MTAIRVIFRRNLFLLFFLLLMVHAATAAPAEKKYLMYVGTYTQEGSKSKGIYSYRFDADSGQVTPIGLAAETINPSFLVMHPNHRFLYAVNEVGNYKGQKSGAVSAFAIDQATGKLSLLNQVATNGADPCYITVDKTGKNVLVANYTGGSVAVFPVHEDGHLGEASAFVQHSGHGTDPKRQEGPHAHSIDLSSDNRFAIVDDLGLDETLVYKFDAANGTLTANDPAFVKSEAGAGPRHFAFRPDGKFGYVINEMGSTVTVFAFDANAGSLRPLQTVSTLPKGSTKHNDDAEIQIDAAGKFLYASNRGHDSITVFAINADKGTLTPVQDAPTLGESPRYFAIAPGGKILFAANEKADNIVVFRVDQNNGRLTPTGKVMDLVEPVCVVFVPVE